MTKSVFKNVKIKGICTVVPQKEIDIYDEIQYYDNNVKKIDRMRKMIGVHKRRVVEQNTTASDLGIAAAEKLFAEMNIDKKSIDALVFVVQKPDFLAPASAYYIHKELGLSDETVAFDVNNGCSGFVYGMWIASQMIESKTCKKILLICADTPTHAVDIEDRNLAPLFGDAGTAVILEYSKEETKSFYNIETRTSGYEAIINPSSGYRFNLNLNKDEDFELLCKLKEKKMETPSGYKTSFFNDYLDGLAVFNFTISVVPESIKTLMDYAKINQEGIDTLCLHQANKQIVQSIGNAIEFSEDKVPYSAFENYGNNTMCSIPTLICTELQEKTKNGKIKILASGFGNGLTCASCIIELDNICNTGIIEYKTPKTAKTRDEYIDYWVNKMKG